MSNETKISANSVNKTATVASENFIADITKDYCLINLENQTFYITARHFRSMFLAFELAEALTEE